MYDILSLDSVKINLIKIQFWFRSAKFDAAIDEEHLLVHSFRKALLFFILNTKLGLSWSNNRIFIYDFAVIRVRKNAFFDILRNLLVGIIFIFKTRNSKKEVRKNVNKIISRICPLMLRLRQQSMSATKPLANYSSSDVCFSQMFSFISFGLYSFNRLIEWIFYVESNIFFY